MTPVANGKSPQMHVSMGGIKKEKLPLQYVHYPSHYGTFFAFSESKTSPPFFCECSVGPIENYFKLAQPSEIETNPYQSIFPPAVVPVVNAGIIENLQFRKSVCHRCNLNPPTMLYCHEMYGVRFVQSFGWYINQNYLKFGIWGHKYLESITPPELALDVKEIESADKNLQSAQRALMAIENGKDRGEIHKQTLVVRELEKASRQANKKLNSKIENITRQEFGYKKIGDRWTSETMLFQIAGVLFQGSEILRHYRPEWLQGLEYDIYIPHIKLAIEYQGQQHFFAIEAWGGEKALEKVKQRDVKKVMLSQNLGIRLLTIDYTEPLTADYIGSRIKQRLNNPA